MLNSTWFDTVDKMHHFSPSLRTGFRSAPDVKNIRLWISGLFLWQGSAVVYQYQVNQCPCICFFSHRNRKKRIPRPPPKALQKEDSDSVWNELAYHRKEHRNLVIEKWVTQNLDSPERKVFIMHQPNQLRPISRRSSKNFSLPSNWYQVLVGDATTL